MPRPSPTREQRDRADRATAFAAGTLLLLMVAGGAAYWAVAPPADPAAAKREQLRAILSPPPKPAGWDMIDLKDHFEGRLARAKLRMVTRGGLYLIEDHWDDRFDALAGDPACDTPRVGVTAHADARLARDYCRAIKPEDKAVWRRFAFVARKPDRPGLAAAVVALLPPE